MSSPTAPASATTTCVVTIDLRSSPGERYTVPAWRTRHAIRRTLDAVSAGDIVQLRVNRWSLLSDIDGLVPADVRVQVSADDNATAREWHQALESRS